ncbi:hypothetical protein [Clostridium perfringens]|uniref:hypothetical protein n=1 Tax=Clostridium perfringens TaxID=1502 RepID=UPI002448EF74|nr:hypothetical protein [Clostridium perfringens]ELC8386684.1 hypothetical protein [Clostridium perfringens]ELC8406229.1 hypothetical protein [Clostridium perfringens]MDH2460364.1 hypothetical protein [Clostridium perfringens]
MLDLDLLNKPIDIKIKGEQIKVNQPSFALAKSVRAFERNINSMEEEEIYDEQSNILLSFLNNNADSKKFKKDALESLPFSAIKAIYKSLVDAITGADNNPN